MLPYYAITPDVFTEAVIGCDSDAGRFHALKEMLRRIDQYGFLVNLQGIGCWEKTVAIEVARLPQSKRDKIQSLLSRIKSGQKLVLDNKCGYSLVEDWAFPSDSLWLKAAEDYDCNNALRAVVHSELLDSPSQILSDEFKSKIQIIADDSHEGQCWPNGTIDHTFRREEKGFRAILAPLLRYQLKMSLIDPYIAPNVSSGDGAYGNPARFQPIMRLSCELLGRGLSTGQRMRLAVHTAWNSNKMSQPEKDAIENDWRGFFQPILQNQPNLRVTVVYWWRKTPQNGSFHNRYVLTKSAAILTPDGLDIGSNETTWLLTSEKTRRELAGAFLDANQDIGNLPPNRRPTHRFEI